MLDSLRYKIQDHKLTLTLSGLCIALAVVSLFLVMRPHKEPLPFPETHLSQENLPEKKEQSQSTATKEANHLNRTKTATIVIDIKGAVRNEGVYEVAPNARVNDAIKAAGGFSETADKKSVNLAQKLTDEALIYVASLGENISAINTPELSASTSTTNGKINLNTATIADLTSISGIGDKRAQDIIDYRDSIGGFKSVDELKNVSGIGDKTFDKIAQEVSLD